MDSLCLQILRLIHNGYDRVAIEHIKTRARGVPVVDFVACLLAQDYGYEMMFKNLFVDIKTEPVLYWTIRYYVALIRGELFV